MKYPLVERTGGYIFMNENFEWFLSNHTSLKGEAAKQHLIKVLKTRKDLIAGIEEVLKKSLSKNKLVKSSSLPDTVMYTDDALSTIAIELEFLLEEINETLGKF